MIKVSPNSRTNKAHALPTSPGIEMNFSVYCSLLALCYFLFVFGAQLAEMEAEVMEVFSRNGMPRTGEAIVARLRAELDDQALERAVRYRHSLDSLEGAQIVRHGDFLEVELSVSVEVNAPFNPDLPKELSYSRRALVYLPRNREVFDYFFNRVIASVAVIGIPYLILNQEDFDAARCAELGLVFAFTLLIAFLVRNYAL